MRVRLVPLQKLAYSQEFFRSRPNFPNHYGKIRELVLRPGTQVFGFSALGDIGFVVSACERYSLPVLFFSAYDLERIIKSEDEIFGSLEKRCEILGIDNSDLRAHRSSDDALMTMRLLKAFCRKSEIQVEKIMEENAGSLCSTKGFLKKREEREKKKIRQARFARERARGNGRRREQPKSGAALQRRKKDSRTLNFD